MLGIFALLSMGFGLSMLLSDGAEGGGGNPESESFDGEFFETTGTGSDLLDQLDTDLVGVAPGEIPLTELVEDSDETGGSDVPYENDVVLEELELIEIADDTVVHMIGTEHDDLLVGNSDSNMISGNAGNDHLYGGTGSDTIFGGDGDDIVVASSNPLLSDGAAASELYGGSGDDTLIGENDDRLVGGDGIDFFNVFTNGLLGGPIAHISDFDASSESLLIELRDGQIGGELDFELEQVESGVAVLVQGVHVVLLEGLEDTSQLNIFARSVGS